MIPSVIAVWAMSMPAGYLAGDVYSQDTEANSYLPLIAALLPPVAAMLAFVCILQAQKGETE